MKVHLSIYASFVAIAVSLATLFNVDTMTAPKFDGPGIKRLSATFAWAPDSTIAVGATVYLKGTLKVGEAIRYKVFKDDVVVLNEVPSPPALTYAANVSAPAYGQTSTYKLCAHVVYANGTQTGMACSGNRVFTRDPLPEPPATIDSVVQVVVRSRPMPAAATVTLVGQEPAAKNQVQFCAFAVLKSGRRVKLENSWNNPVCEELYQSWLTESSA